MEPKIGSKIVVLNKSNVEAEIMDYCFADDFEEYDNIPCTPSVEDSRIARKLIDEYNEKGYFTITKIDKEDCDDKREWSYYVNDTVYFLFFDEFELIPSMDNNKNFKVKLS